MYMAHPGGRPTVYRPEMPQEMLEMMTNGYKDSWIYAEWGISKDTFYRWLKEHPELKVAHDTGMPLCEVWWEKKGVDLMAAGDNKAFNYWIAFMNRKFGWSKNQGNNGGDTTININQMAVFNQQTREELLENITMLLDDTGAAEKIPSTIEAEVKVLNGSDKQD
jgi:hypothetical protein